MLPEYKKGFVYSDCWVQDARLVVLNARDAADKGATVIPINPANEDFTGRPKLLPRILLNTTDDMRIRQDEIFGPLLPVVPYNHLDEALAFINARPLYF